MLQIYIDEKFSLFKDEILVQKSANFFAWEEVSGL